MFGGLTQGNLSGRNTRGALACAAIWHWEMPSAKMTIAIKVLTEDYYNARVTDTKALRPAEELARSAYLFTLKQKKRLAAANVINSVDSVLSMLPF